MAAAPATMGQDIDVPGSACSLQEFASSSPSLVAEYTLCYRTARRCGRQGQVNPQHTLCESSRHYRAFTPIQEDALTHALGCVYHPTTQLN